jgi:hypothetical protein
MKGADYRLKTQGRDSQGGAVAAMEVRYRKEFFAVCSIIISPFFSIEMLLYQNTLHIIVDSATFLRTGQDE